MKNKKRLLRPASLARLRFAAVSSLFYDPPLKGQLKARLQALAKTTFKDPDTGQSVQFGVSTLQRWFYQAKEQVDPIAALMSHQRTEAGTHPSVSEPLRDILAKLHADHPTWTYQLSYDNAVVLAKEANLSFPTYATIVRFMRDAGMTRVRAGKRRFEHERNLPHRETRSYEVAYAHALWHCDFHVGTRKVILPNGSYAKAKLFAAVDDFSRLQCHAQWYLEENAENFVHGISQAFMKRGLPRALMSDRGKAMLASECQEGLSRLGIEHSPTLSRSPEQNGKAESFWGQIEGRLLPMLDNLESITLPFLNQATQAFVEVEYNHKKHSETGEPPLQRLANAKSVARPAPSLETIRRAFQRQVTRRQRLSDGTVSVDGVRFEIPNRFRTLRELTLRYAAWDLSHIDLVDARTNTLICSLFPLDKEANADKLRRVIDLPDHDVPRTNKSGQPAPLLSDLLAKYAATGMPPAYLPKDELPAKDEPL